MLIIKKLTKQCAPCPSASIMILQKGIAISLEGRHLVLTLLASSNYTPCVEGEYLIILHCYEFSLNTNRIYENTEVSNS